MGPARAACRRLLPILIPLLAGCAALFPPAPGSLESRLDQWESEEEYGKALSALAAEPARIEEQPALAERRDRIQAKADAYARDTVLKAQALVAADSWQEAWALYGQALDRIPDHPVLLEGYERFRADQEKELVRIDLDLLIARGESLVHQLPILTQRADVAAADRSARGELAAARAEAREVAAQLLKRGLKALSSNKITTAQRTLPLAARLDPNPQTLAARNKLTRLVAQRSRAETERKSAEQSERRQAAVADTLSAFEAAYQHGELAEAKRLMARLKELDSRDPRIRDLESGLEQRVDRTVETHLQAGSSFYSRGEFEDAIEQWRLALVLEPDNAQARANLERAERVIAKLRELREKQAQ